MRYDRLVNPYRWAIMGSLTRKQGLLVIALGGYIVSRVLRVFSGLPVGNWQGWVTGGLVLVVLFEVMLVVSGLIAGWLISRGYGSSRG